MTKLTENQWNTLFTLTDKGPMSVIEISRLTHEPDTGERTRLERMERLGLAKRVRVSGKGRTRHLWMVTPEGRSEMNAALTKP